MLAFIIKWSGLLVACWLIYTVLAFAGHWIVTNSHSPGFIVNNYGTITWAIIAVVFFTGARYSVKD
jgi:hypothetical protein